ncbi:Hypothetical protein, putative [Bodo saltans]|uniref:Uncharacterized protein n=1 Tax=Bodo saltans TaxID=75058 RepID=A0A0S4JDQ5_BODSA|nr:Hypothetical protein, putative [Bodo saltans]|eukprot:CUG87117.1 Hypothetical protein, putative [Bodo saltans]
MRRWFRFELPTAVRLTQKVASRSCATVATKKKRFEKRHPSSPRDAARHSLQSLFEAATASCQSLLQTPLDATTPTVDIPHQAAATVKVIVAYLEFWNAASTSEEEQQLPDALISRFLVCLHRLVSFPALGAQLDLELDYMGDLDVDDACVPANNVAAKAGGEAPISILILRMLMASCVPSMEPRLTSKVLHELFELAARISFAQRPGLIDNAAMHLRPSHDMLLFGVFATKILQNPRTYYTFTKIIESLIRNCSFRTSFRGFANNSELLHTQLSKTRRESVSLELYRLAQALKLLKNNVDYDDVEATLQRKKNQGTLFVADTLHCVSFQNPHSIKIEDRFDECVTSLVNERFQQKYFIGHHCVAMMSSRYLCLLTSDLAQLSRCSSPEQDLILNRIQFQTDTTAAAILRMRENLNVRRWHNLLWFPTHHAWSNIDSTLMGIGTLTSIKTHSSLRQLYAALSTVALRERIAAFFLRSFHSEWLPEKLSCEMEKIIGDEIVVAFTELWNHHSVDAESKTSTQANYDLDQIYVRVSVRLRLWLFALETQLHVSLSVAFRFIDIVMHQPSHPPTTVKAVHNGNDDVILVPLTSVFRAIALMLSKCKLSGVTAHSDCHERGYAILYAMNCMPHSCADALHRKLLCIIGELPSHGHPRCNSGGPTHVNRILCSIALLCHLEAFLCFVTDFAAQNVTSGSHVLELVERVVRQQLLFSLEAPLSILIAEHAARAEELFPLLWLMFTEHKSVKNDSSALLVELTQEAVAISLEPELDACLRTIEAQAAPVALPATLHSTRHVRDVCVSHIAQRQCTLAEYAVSLQRYLVFTLPTEIANEIGAVLLARHDHSDSTCDALCATVQSLLSPLHECPPSLVVLAATITQLQNTSPPPKVASKPSPTFEPAIQALYRLEKKRNSEHWLSSHFGYVTLGDAILANFLFTQAQWGHPTDTAVDGVHTTPSSSAAMDVLWRVHPVLLMRCWVRMLDVDDDSGEKAGMLWHAVRCEPSRPLIAIEVPHAIDLVSQLSLVLRALPQLSSADHRNGHANVRSTTRRVATNATRWVWTLMLQFCASENEGMNVRLCGSLQPPALMRLFDSIEIMSQYLEGPLATDGLSLLVEVLTGVIVDVDKRKQELLSHRDLHHMAARIGHLLTQMSAHPHGAHVKSITPRLPQLVYDWVCCPGQSSGMGGDSERNNNVITQWIEGVRRVCTLLPSDAALCLVHVPLCAALETALQQLKEVQHAVGEMEALLDGAASCGLHIPALSSMIVKALLAMSMSAESGSDSSPRLLKLFHAMLRCDGNYSHHQRPGEIHHTRVRYATNHEANRPWYCFSSPLSSTEVMQCGEYILKVAEGHIVASHASAVVISMHMCAVGLEMLELLSSVSRPRGESSSLTALAILLCREYIFTCPHVSCEQAARAVRVASRMRLQWTDNDGNIATAKTLAAHFFERADDVTKVALICALVTDMSDKTFADEDDAVDAWAAVLTTFLHQVLDHVNLDVGLIDTILHSCLVPLATLTSNNNNLHVESVGLLRSAAKEIYHKAVLHWMQKCSPSLDWKRHMALNFVRVAAMLYPGDPVNGPHHNKNDEEYHCILASLYFVCMPPEAVVLYQRAPQLAECEAWLFSLDASGLQLSTGQAGIDLPLRLDVSQCLQALESWWRLSLPPSEQFLTPCLKRLEIASKAPGCRTQQCVEMLEACLTFGVAPRAWMTSMVLRLNEEQHRGDSARERGAFDAAGGLFTRQHVNSGLLLPLSERALIVCRVFSEEYGVHLPHYVKRWTPSITSELLQ